jgi:ribosomal protein L40E
MGYLICDKCKGYYEFQNSESSDNFSLKCDCGGKLKYFETLESSDDNIEKISSTMACPYCGAKNPDSAKLCKSCKRLLTEIKWNKPSKSNNKEKSAGVTFETWNKQSNSVKAMSIITVCCIGLILILSVNAIFSPDKYTQNNLQAQTSSLQSTAGYSLNSAVNGIISYYDTSFKNFFQNLINTGHNAASG